MVFPVESQARVRSAPLLPLTTRIGPVHIGITDKAAALTIWRDVVGLTLIAESASALRLGVAGKTLIALQLDATRPVPSGTLGLYHVAIHVPSRPDLAQMAVRALKARVRIAPTDHLVSEAIYLWDADGNGIEMTFETPWRGTLGDPDAGAYAVTRDGTPHSGREPIDLDGLIAELGDNPVHQASLPQGTRIGHVHLHVADLDAAMGFYRDGLGFGGLFIIRSFGMGDVGLDYVPHTIAFNIWAGAAARQPPAGSAGLRTFTITLPDAEALAGVAARLSDRGDVFSLTPGELKTADPSGNRLTLTVATPTP